MNPPSIASVYLATQPDFPILGPRPDCFLSISKGGIEQFFALTSDSFAIRGQRISLRKMPLVEIHFCSTIRPIEGRIKCRHQQTFGLINLGRAGVAAPPKSNMTLPAAIF